jgi:hypothetical protein
MTTLSTTSPGDAGQIPPSVRPRSFFLDHLPFRGWVLIGLLGLIALDAAPFFLFPMVLFPLFVLLPFVLARAVGALSWGVVGETATDAHFLRDRETELLEALERNRELTPARAALETSLTVSEADEMLSGLAERGYIDVRAEGRRLTYALSEQDRRPAAPRKGLSDSGRYGDWRDDAPPGAA